MEKKNICWLLLIGSIVFLLKANPILASDYQAIPTPANLGLFPTASGFLISWSSGAIDAVQNIYWRTDASVNEVN